MGQVAIIQPEAITTLAPTVEIKSKGGTSWTVHAEYFPPSSPYNPEPGNHTLQYCNVDTFFSRKIEVVNIHSPMERADATIQKNRQIILAASSKPELKEPFIRALQVHEETRRMQEIRFELSTIDYLPVFALCEAQCYIEEFIFALQAAKYDT